MLSRIKIVPGSEFRRAFQETRALGFPAAVKLIDRPLEITLARTWASLSWWERIKLGGYIMLADLDVTDEEIEKMKQSDGA